MKRTSSKLRHQPWLLLGLLLLAVTACVPIRSEASWPAVGKLGSDNNILMAYNDRVVIVDGSDGTPLRLRNADGEVRVDEEGNPRIWEFTGPQAAPNQFFSAPVLVGSDNLLIPSYTEKLYQVDLSTARSSSTDGHTLPGRALANPAFNEGLVYIGIERDLIALDSTTLEERWRKVTDQGVWSTPLIVGDTLYFTSLDHYLYALDPATGEEQWKLELDGAAPESPILYENKLYLGSFARKIYEISLDGDILSEYPTNDWVWGAPTIVNDVLYAGDASGMVYAVNLTSSGLQQRWSVQVAERAIRATPLVEGEYVVVGSRDHRVYWLDRADGSIFWSREVAGEVLSNLLLIEADPTEGIEEPLVVVGTPTNHEYLVAFTLQNGERTWSYPPAS